MAIGQLEGHRKLSAKIAAILQEVRSSNATHRRKLKEILALRLSSPAEFCAAFCEALVPLFNFQRRNSSSERTIKFVSSFACSSSDKDDSGDEFLENFLRFLLLAATAANKTARFRACQIVSEIIMRLPDDMEVSSELWDEVIECMKIRAGDKIPTVRTFAIRSLARFANDSENRDILELFLEKLPLEQNGDVRKILVLSLPPSSETLSMIIDCTLDVNESARKAAYCVLASKFPLQSLSIKLRATILQRGLAERSAAVAKECFRMMKDEWHEKCCNGDPIELLKFLDVETYESVGETVMSTLLKAGLVKLQDGQTLREFIAPGGDSAEGGNCSHSIELMDAEVAVFWRVVCRHLNIEAHKKGSDAAMTMGTESTVYAEEASHNNDLLDRILPASVSDYVELVNAHIVAGANYRFVSRQLLLLGTMLDFSDVSNRKVASVFLQDLLHKALDHELDESGNEVIIGDGFNLGGEKNWAAAVAELCKKVHAAAGEFEEVVLNVVEELAQPCRERTADWKKWLHCLAVVGLLLENTTSFRHMQGNAIDPTEILHSLLLPGAKHSNLDVQRASVRCLGLFGLLERKPNEDIGKQLRCSFVKGPSTVSIMAAKALLDLAIWHGPDEMDKVMNCNLSSDIHDDEVSSTLFEFGEGHEDSNFELLDLLCVGLEHDWDDLEEIEDHQSIQDVLGEGLAKILLLSNKFPGSHTSKHHLILAKLIRLYFSSDNEEFQRLKQCLSVFFEHYPSLSINHKKCLAKAFMPVMRSLWPGINGNAAGSTMMVSNMRKIAVQASRFMLQMIQAPLLAKDSTSTEENKSENPSVETCLSLDLESEEEGLAVRIAVEVASFDAKKTAAEKSYVAALCKILVLLQFRVSEQGVIKLMRRILSRASAVVAAEKDLTKELRHMAEHLKAIDRNPDEQLSSEQASQILEKLELTFNLEKDDSTEAAPTPAPQSIRPRPTRRRARAHKDSSSNDEGSPTSVVPNTPVIGTRSQRASKTAAMSKMAAKTTVKIDEYGSEDDEDEALAEVTSEDDSDASV
ncbi:condensin complex subunit 3-like isoform X2 [Salvia splendens]|uniref:condensin complex subunit 3-like isoform X2 n=1 Tax=Salvia splendens TaxID=180675 RepID=UPI001C277DA7|nr:condensin complex subunit 3-like isoform X2 [Salvia splendens]